MGSRSMSLVPPDELVFLAFDTQIKRLVEVHVLNNGAQLVLLLNARPLSVLKWPRQFVVRPSCELSMWVRIRGLFSIRAILMRVSLLPTTSTVVVRYHLPRCFRFCYKCSTT